MGWDDFLTWYQSLDDQMVTSSNLTILIYLIKNKHKVKWVCTSFKLKELSLERGMLENNINYIMRSHQTFSTFRLRRFFDRYYIATFRLYDKLYFIKINYNRPSQFISFFVEWLFHFVHCEKWITVYKYVKLEKPKCMHLMVYKTSPLA